MRLDHQIQLKYAPINLLTGIAPAPKFPILLILNPIYEINQYILMFS